MGLALTASHQELAATVRRFLEKHAALSEARRAVEDGPSLPSFWSKVAELGLLGLHVAEDLGGSGFGLLEAAVVAEEFGRACVPGPFLSSAVVAGLINDVSVADRQRELVPEIVAGRLLVGLGTRGRIRRDGDELHGSAVVMHGAECGLMALVVEDDVVLVDPGAGGLTIRGRQNLDPSRPCATVLCSGVVVPADRVIVGGAVHAEALTAVLGAAEAAGGAEACTEMAATYANERRAFGRPIGQFQAVKHHCANMLIEHTMSSAAAWDAARRPEDRLALHAAGLLAATVALAAFTRCAKLNIQVHGGIGFTWEHDAHLYLRRAAALSAFVGPVPVLQERSSELALANAASGAAVRLPDSLEDFRRDVRAFVGRWEQASGDDRCTQLVDSGYLFPHWPRPWGINATAAEQLVIDDEFGSLSRVAHLGATGWTVPIVLPTVITHGTNAQCERWVLPTLRGEVKWCQLFSEPGAGSDLASLSTRAVRTDGGWLVSGQKVWNSHAHVADFGFALVRTNPAADRHRGITCMVIDMCSPGVTVRPLRQLTGTAEFNEVFLDEVFVPDSDVIGEVDKGWSVARTTLGNERASIGDAASALPAGWTDIARRALEARADRPDLGARLGAIVARLWAARAVNLRSVVRAVERTDHGVDGDLTKLVMSEQAQQIADFAEELLGKDAVFADEDAEWAATVFLLSRSTTIAGGTAEINRNVLAERALGLPREPRG